ncbi:hypothetical protein Pla52n_33120 [Stieleria varia]|uniref:Uncharacterized protein n=1 Tax=Stieleria varia TaxID=2528005 RepID=A0A5C6ATC6_9BACT|nr:hypothetical protein Pla52n_33120 [Stieleria varia]
MSTAGSLVMRGVQNARSTLTRRRPLLKRLEHFAGTSGSVYFGEFSVKMQNPASKNKRAWLLCPCCLGK